MITDILGALNAIYGAIGTTVTIGESSIGYFHGRAEKLDKTKLDELAANLDFSGVQEEHREVTEYFCQRFLSESSSGRFFSEQDIHEFCDYYFKRNPTAFGDKDNITTSLTYFLESYDYWLHKNMSVGEQTIYQQNKRHHRELMQAISQNDVQSPADLFSANALYADAFAKVMFLHDRETDTEVTLKNLYVNPHYVEIGNKSLTFSQRLAEFVQHQDEKFLLIEGNAGNGKTTLVEWLNYHHRSGTVEVRNILNGRSLITIRLRDMERGTLENGLFLAIWRYIYPKTPLKEEEYAKLLESSVFILDGFDELCTIDKIADCDKTLSEFSRLLMGSRLSVKVIITSRPNYINKLENEWKRLTLTAFDELQREEWLANYTNKCKQTIAPHITSYIHSLSERRNVIFDTPLTLYMVVAKQLEKNALENNWLLYHSIFYEKTRDTEYNRMTESSLFSDPSHPSREYWDIYYQINEEIAYRMYQTDNSCLYVDFNEIKEIIQELSAKCDELMEANIQSIVQRCHALCGFWKIRTDDGYLEFYHNDIRDFFLCEKFYRTINALYHSKEWDKEKNAVKLVELFQYADVQPKVFEFVKQRSWCGKEHLDYFCKNDFQLLNNWYFPAIFQDLMTNGMLFLQATTRGKGQEGIWSKNPVKGFATATFSILNFYNVVLVPVWDKMKYIELWPYNHPMKVSGMFLSLLTLNDWFLFLEKMDLSGMFMRNMCFDNSNLRFANLSGAKLNHSSFQYADLRYVDLQNADLENANLERANLSYANLTNAFLKDTILPDGYYCRSQDEAVAYMKALNIEGLII